MGEYQHWQVPGLVPVNTILDVYILYIMYVCTIGVSIVDPVPDAFIFDDHLPISLHLKVGTIPPTLVQCCCVLHSACVTILLQLFVSIMVWAL